MADLTRGITFTAYTLARAAYMNSELNRFLSNINTRICADGTEHFVGTDPFTLEYNDPYIEFIDTQTSGETWRILATVDTTAWLEVGYYTTSWQTLMRLPYDPTSDEAELDFYMRVWDVRINCDVPKLIFDGTEGSGEIWRMSESAGSFLLQCYDSSGTPHWDNVLSFAHSSGDATFGGVVKVDEIADVGGSGVTIDVADKQISAPALNMDKVCTLHFVNANFGSYVSTTTRRAGLPLNPQPSNSNPIIFPVITNVTLQSGAAHAWCTVGKLANETWYIYCFIWGFQTGTNNVDVDVYVFQDDPADA